MKIQLIFYIIIFCTLNYSCQKCELIDQDIVYPPSPDPCHGPFYINYHEPFTANTEFFFNEIPKPVPDPLTFIERYGPDTILSIFSYWPYNFSAFDKTRNSYVYEYLYTQLGPKTITFQHHN